jgi:6-phosphogluconolactonase
MNFRIFDSTDDLVHAAARTIVQRASAAPSFSIAVSGGKTPEPFYKLLGQTPFRDELAGITVTWVIVDERYVPFNHPDSNAGMIQRTLFASGMTPGHRFLPFRTHFPDPHESATHFEEEWRSLGLEQLDVVLLGVGEDGHTASLFPGTEALGVEGRIATANFVPRLDMWRVTITKPVIRGAKLRIVLAEGEEKQPILRELRAGAKYPIAEVTGGELETWWFVDKAAVGDGTT